MVSVIPHAAAVPEADNAVRHLAPQEMLFKAGDPKTHLYRVESGAICLYEPRRDGDQAVVEFLFPGDLVGLGFLETHTLSARALLDAKVTKLPAQAASSLVAGDSIAEAKLAEAIEREFEARRARLSNAGRTKPIERVASLLVNLSCSNVYEAAIPISLAIGSTARHGPTCSVSASRNWPMSSCTSSRGSWSSQLFLRVCGSMISPRWRPWPTAQRRARHSNARVESSHRGSRSLSRKPHDAR
jgi:cAMP-binding proteins - catabolite gene activator and regulatory subunit of cAMP-dependent protein kinases